MAINNSQRAAWPNELLGNMTTGSTVEIGRLTQNPVIMIFDNQGTHAVEICVNDATGSNVWKTFPAGEALTLDLRNQQGIVSNFTADIGTTFYGTGTTGDSFSISYVSALNT